MKDTTWKTVTIQNKPDLSKFNISDYAQDMLDKIKHPVKKQTIELVKLQVKDLWIQENYPTVTQIFEKAKVLGLELCPPQVGPQLRLDYHDQPLNEWMYIAMEPVTDRYGYPDVFVLERDASGLWLRGSWARPDGRWHPETQLVFALRKSLKLKPFDSDTLDLEKRVKELEDKMKKIEKVLRI